MSHSAHVNAITTPSIRGHHHRLLGFALILALLAGCANTGANYRPIVDTKGVTDSSKYEADLRECQAFATQTTGAGERAVAGALAGAALGALLAAAAGSRYSRNQHAGVGAVAGAAAGAGQGETDQRTIIRRCMDGRGYNVLM